MSDVIKHPAYLNALDVMEEQGLDYGSEWTVEELEEMMRAKRDTWEFRNGLMQIVNELRKQGYWLTSRGKNGEAYYVATPEMNVCKMASHSRRAFRELANAVVLGSATDVTLLNEDERRRHEAMLERTAIRLALLRRKKLPENMQMKIEHKESQS